MPLSKTYKPEEIEGPHYQRWEEEGAFAAGRTNTGKPYTIVIPPPNVTGSLHMGHALNNTLQDVLIRFERMRGRDALWQPGMDHAGIATQMVVERQLEAEGTDRRKLGRSKFVERVWDWKEESGGTIFNQLRRLGASADWQRERFTMDEGLSRAVTKVFVDLHKQGLIYKDQRLVNWDPKLLTAISDLEVENRESRGHLWHIKYPIENEEGRYIVVATTRPETMLGDTAVAVHPDDARYKDLIGKSVVLPLVGRRIPIIADDYADPEQGSGAVKITPGHDFNDFEVGRRHRLELINIFDAHAHLNDNVPEGYRGLERMAARKEVLAHLEAQGLLEKIDDITNTVPYGDRSGVIIEPWLTDQWYADAATLAKPAIEAVERGNITFVPRQWENTYFSWMRNIQPWCISRQLWWGHQIPAWYGPDGQVFVELDEEAALNAAKLHYGRETPLERDPDVLDTWFSSALWPFSTLGWPDKTPLLERHYPTDVLVTGFDIIFFWVARMIMMGLHFMGEVPFHTVYVHALVRDEKGAKMSKSKGNVIDPLALIDEYGADALRFTLSAMAAQGRDIKLAKTRVEGYRNFATKLWNAARFAEMNVCLLRPDFEPGAVRLTVNKWIVGETARAAAAITEAIQAYKFNEAADAAYHFTWHTYCDWYVELIKPVLMGPRAAPGMESLPLEEGEVRPQAGEGVGAQDAPPMPDDDPATIQAREETRACAAWALSQILHLLHPFMPFVTEELWDKLRNESPIPETKDLIVSGWPDASALPMDKAAADEMNWVIKLVSEIRSVRAEMNIPVAAKMDAKLVGAHTETQARLATHAELINRLARLNSIDLADQPPPGAVQVIIDEATVALPLAGVIDIAAERARLEKEIQKSESEIKKVDSKLANDAFVAKAPPHVIEEQHTRRADHAQTRDKLAAALERLKKVG